MKLYIKRARASYVQSLFEAKAANVAGPGKPKHSISLIITPETLSFAGDANPESPLGKQKGYAYGPFKAGAGVAINDAATAKWADKAKDVLTQLKAQNRILLRSGAEKANTPGYAGNMFINASSATRPQIRNSTGAQLNENEGVIYSGCYVDAVVDVWAQDNQHGKRMNAELLAVVFSGPGERLAGGSVATDDDYAAILQAAPAGAPAVAPADFWS